MLIDAGFAITGPADVPARMYSPGKAPAPPPHIPIFVSSGFFHIQAHQRLNSPAGGWGAAAAAAAAKRHHPCLLSPIS